MEKQKNSSISGEGTATCIVSGVTQPLQDMLRLVISPDGVLLCDLKGKLPVDGVYVQATHIAVRQAIEVESLKNQLITTPNMDDFIDNIQKQLHKRIAQWLSMANKAGGLIAGFVKVESALRAGEVRLLLQAGDASDDGRKKLRNIAVREEIAIDESLTRDFLSNALGKSDAVHIGILTTDFSAEILREMRRYTRFCETDSL